MKTPLPAVSRNQRHDAKNLPFVRLLRHVDISAYGSELMAVGDIDGDGRQEFIFSQSTGMLAADVFKPGANGHYGSRYTTPEDQALDCMTAIDPDGNIRWQQGTPWRGKIPFRQHGGDEMLRIEDLDGDGRLEILRIRGNRLQILDGASGAPIRETILDSDGYSSLLTARFTRGGARHIVVKPCSDGLDGHPYCCPVVAYDHQFRQTWDRRDFLHAGHVPRAFDVDGDGLDELLIGFQCVNPDGTVRWTLPLEGGSGHPDRRTIADVDSDGEIEQILACEDFGVVVTTLTGKVKWQRKARHCGEACVGKFHADIAGLQIMANDETWRVGGDEEDGGASCLLDGRGKLIWSSPHDRYALAIDWPTTTGPQAMLAKPHLADPPDARPFILDGNGAILARFDIPPRLPSIRDVAVPHGGICWGDWGDYYGSRCADLDGRGQRIIVWSRRDLWIFATEIESF